MYCNIPRIDVCFLFAKQPSLQGPQAISQEKDTFSREYVHIKQTNAMFVGEKAGVD